MTLAEIQAGMAQLQAQLTSGSVVTDDEVNRLGQLTSALAAELSVPAEDPPADVPTDAPADDQSADGSDAPVGMPDSPPVASGDGSQTNC